MLIDWSRKYPHFLHLKIELIWWLWKGSTPATKSVHYATSNFAYIFIFLLQCHHGMRSMQVAKWLQSQVIDVAVPNKPSDTLPV